MAPPPEYDKEPKAPDKNVTTQCSDDSKVLYNIVKDQQTNQDHKVSTTTGSAEAENKHVETLDDGQLRALLDEAITYKCPKDREGKSSLFKELLHEVEQDEQACEAACEAACSAARGLSAGRAARRGAGGAGAGAGARGRRELQSNSLQDLVAAMAAEPAGLPAPRRPRAAPPAQVSARAHHGGSLPSGVDTSSLLSEEPQPRGGYLATVRCVNPPPLAERRVSASDANPPADVDLLARRSKPTFPMTYTARATLEIGSGSVCSGRAVTTTTASNQVRTTPVTAPRHPRAPRPPPAAALAAHTADPGQAKLMNAIRPSGRDAKRNVGGGGPDDDVPPPAPDGARNGVPRGQKQSNDPKRAKQNSGNRNVAARNDPVGQQWVNSVHNWYDGLSDIQPLLNSFMSTNAPAKIFERSAPVSPVKSQVPKTSKEMTEVEHQTDTAPYDLSHDQTKFKNKVWEMNTIPKKLSETKLENSCSDMYDENVTMLRNKYREQVGYDLVPPRLLPLNPTSFRKTTIGTESSSLFHSNISSTNHPNETNKKNTFHKSNSSKHNESASKMLDGESNLHESSTESYNELNCKNQSHRSARNKLSKKLAPENTSMELHCIESSKVQMEKPANVGMPKLSTIIHDNKNISKKRTITNAEPRENEIELADIPPCNDVRNSDDFLQHLAAQQRFLENLENDSHNSSNLESRASERGDKLRMDKIKDEERVKDEFNSEKFEVELGPAQENVVELNENSSENREKFIFAELPNNAYVFLTLPQSFFSLTQKSNNNVSLKEIEDNNNVTPYTSGSNNTLAKKSKKKNKRKKESHTPEKNSMKHNAVNKSALKLLLYSDSTDKSTSGMSLNCNKEVDSAIPFTCITTPEVVASCNTTSSTSSAVAVDPKPLQLGSCYRAVASLTGEWSPAAAPAQPPAAEPPAPEPAPAPAPALALANAAHLQPRGAGGGGSGGFNGLPLSRPGYGATASTASTTTDEYKKSLDENGNAVQGFSSPLSGSSQHKKPRRKKSSKNETVIKSHQIDGYQGNKDLNEVLRFIESNADSARGHKLGRAKHKDDSDDKAGKKRSSERRKDKENKVKRASSLEELSRTKLEDLTDQPAPRPPRVPPAAAPHERRSWGDDARDAFYFRDASDNNPTPAPAPALAATPDPAPDAAAAAAELTDFQTVTKKRKPRRRTDDAAADPPRRTRAPSPRRAPSDRSNDSNDDLDSVHSLPADAPPRPPPAPHASYADIARTRHNIPDLIESCNFYAEGETAAVPPADGDYPALATRGGGGGGGRTRDKPGAPPPRVRKERPEPAAAPPPAPAPAPDVVADRRPPVVLLDSSARPRDMDGITFGFDVNEQLLGAAPRRARCDLVREAADAAEAGAVAVRAGAAALRYVPPRAPPPLQLLQLVDYVGAAWEDVVRCGGKARYFSE